MKPSDDKNRGGDGGRDHHDQDGGGKPVTLDPASLSIGQDVKAHVQFDHSGAGFNNGVGMYTYDSKGNITSTQMMFGDVSANGVAGGPSALDLALKAGDHIGFFVAPNADAGGALQDMIKQGGSFHLVNTTDGQTANVNSGIPMQIAYEAPNGEWSNVKTQYGTSIFTTNTKDNVDGFQHAQVTTDPVTGQIHVSFEDLLNGGDKNFGDANFTVDIGRRNADKLIDQANRGKPDDDDRGHGRHDHDGKGDTDEAHSVSVITDGRVRSDKVVVSIGGLEDDDNVTVTTSVAGTHKVDPTKVSLAKFVEDNGDVVTVSEAMTKHGERVTINTHAGKTEQKVSFLLDGDDANETYVIHVRDNGHDDIVTITTGADGSIANVAISKGDGHRNGHNHGGARDHEDNDNVDFSRFVDGHNGPGGSRNGGGDHGARGGCGGQDHGVSPIGGGCGQVYSVDHGSSVDTTAYLQHALTAPDPLHLGHVFA